MSIVTTMLVLVLQFNVQRIRRLKPIKAVSHDQLHSSFTFSLQPH